MMSDGARTFAIGIIHLDDGCIASELILDDWSEATVLDLTDWTVADYQRQWWSALEQLVARDFSKVVLMTWAAHAQSESIRRAWRLHRSGDIVQVQENLYVPRDMEFGVDQQGIVVDETEFERQNEDGDKISEWSTTVGSIREFLATGQSDVGRVTRKHEERETSDNVRWYVSQDTRPESDDRIRVDCSRTGERPVVRIVLKSVSDIETLRTLLLALAHTDLPSIDLNQNPGFDVEEGLQLTFRRGDVRDHHSPEAVLAPGMSVDDLHISIVLPPDGWEEAALLLDGFRSGSGHHYLAGDEVDAAELVVMYAEE